MQFPMVACCHDFYESIRKWRLPNDRKTPFSPRKERNERSVFYGFGRSFLLTELSLEQADDRRNQRQHENRNDDQLEMLLYGRMPPKK